MDNLFEHADNKKINPQNLLTELLRPKTIETFVGLSSSISNPNLIKTTIEYGLKQHLIFHGPPGTGKTSLALLIGNQKKNKITVINGIEGTSQKLKNSVEQIKNNNQYYSNNSKEIIFIDEIHRLNRIQQDFLLPIMEKHTCMIIGATTENPSFVLTPAIRSRATFVEFYRLPNKDLEQLLNNTCDYINKNKYKYLPKNHDNNNPAIPNFKLSPEAKQKIIQLAEGDARQLLRFTQSLMDNYHTNLNPNITDKAKQTSQQTNWPLQVKQLIQILEPNQNLAYDKNGEHHYNLISALHKAIRGSDVNASLYYLNRMIKSAEDPLYIGRRLIRMASEDIGLADSNALGITINACEAYRQLGKPEGELALSHAVAYLALADKSNSIYNAHKQTMKLIEATGSLPPPRAICNPVTKMMKQQGYGQGYLYDHNYPDAMAGQNFFPEQISPQQQELFQPTQFGQEKLLSKRFELQQQKLKKNQKKSDQ